jgi:hypothetical protein
MTREEILAHIDEGIRQLRSGEVIELRGDKELKAFFDGIKAEGMRRWLARQEMSTDSKDRGVPLQ